MPTISYTWSLQKIPLSGGASLYRHFRECPPDVYASWLVCARNVTLPYDRQVKIHVLSSAAAGPVWST